MQSIVNEPVKFSPFVLYLKDNPTRNRNPDNINELYTYSVEGNTFFLTKINEKDYGPFNALYNRSVNVGNNTLMITGGTVRTEKNSTLINACYLISWDYENNNFSHLSNYRILVRPYANMVEERSRHNILYLPNKNAVFCCSTIDKKPNFTSEITYLNNTNASWKLLRPKLEQSRGNATMAYISERYIYCIAGFQYEGSEYLKSMEYLDYDNMNNVDKWTYICFKNYPSLKDLGGKCTMGVIHIKNNDFIIFGGFDGSNNYCKDAYEVNFNPQMPAMSVVKKVELDNVGDVNIFYSQNFLCIGDGRYVNFNLKCSRYLYIANSKSFNISNPNEAIEYNK